MRRRRRSPAGEMLGVHGAASSVMPLTMLTTAETPGHALDAAPPSGGARCRPLRRFDLQQFHRVGEAFGAIALVLADVTADAATEARRVAALFALGLFARRLPLLFAFPGLNRVEQLDEAFDDRHPPKLAHAVAPKVSRCALVRRVDDRVDPVAELFRPGHAADLPATARVVALHAAAGPRELQAV